MFRHELCSAIACCMPDHIHLLWMGIADSSDQLAAVRYFRKHLNRVLSIADASLQREPFDHVLVTPSEFLRRSNTCLSTLLGTLNESGSSPLITIGSIHTPRA